MQIIGVAILTLVNALLLTTILFVLILVKRQTIWIQQLREELHRVYEMLVTEAALHEKSAESTEEGNVRE